MSDGRIWLVVAGGLSVAASALHLACIAGGPDWYRALGAGDEMAKAAARGRLWPALLTAGIAVVLGIWAFYAFSAAGTFPWLPWRRAVLVMIVLVLSARGLAILAPDLWRPDLSYTFKLWSSVFVLILAACFAAGTWLSWPALSQGNSAQ